jgi:hypothetical protein
VGTALDSVSQITQFQAQLDSSTSHITRFEYLIYDKPVDFEAATEFVSALLRSNDIFPLEKVRCSSQE